MSLKSKLKQTTLSFGGGGKQSTLSRCVLKASPVQPCTNAHRCILHHSSPFSSRHCTIKLLALKLLASSHRIPWETLWLPKRRNCLPCV